MMRQARAGAIWLLALILSGLLLPLLGCGEKKEETAPGYYEGPMKPKGSGGTGAKAGGV
jgi:hypothetical protein